MTASLEESEFLKGINVHAPESRDYANEMIELLRTAAPSIDWIRVHPLPTRKICERNRFGVSYLDALERFASAGFNLVLPIDVGIKENVGVVDGSRLKHFVDESYSESYKAVRMIESRISKYGRRVIYGVENEIDTKEWIMQSMPTIAWRETLPAWAKLSSDRELKFKRLEHIFFGIRDASPDCMTMVNFEADDPFEDWNTRMSFLIGAQTVLSELGLLEKGARRRMNNYRLDVAHSIRKLPVDVIGLDNYPNYFTKTPPRGSEIGSKVNEIARITGRPVINAEFGYSAHSAIRRFFSVLRYRSSESKYLISDDISKEVSEYKFHDGEQHKLRFFENALSSIEASESRGTFPWVLMLDPSRKYRPKEEKGFSLLKFDGRSGALEPVPAFNHYVSWLETIGESFVAERSISARSSEEENMKAKLPKGVRIRRSTEASG